MLKELVQELNEILVAVETLTTENKTMKRERKKAYFVNEHGEIFAAINGRYGVYAKVRGVNMSEKFMLNYVKVI